MGTAPCENRELPDSIESVDQFTGAMVGGESQPINRAIAYLVGRKLDPDSINVGTVILRPAADPAAEVPGAVSFFDLKDCNLALGSCPRGVGFTPNDGSPCDLLGDTTYELVLDGIIRADGSPLMSDGSSLVVTFRTKPVPNNYVPNYCGGAPLWWAINGVDAIDGLTLGIAGAAPFVILLTGIEAVAPWYGYDQPYEPSITLAAWDYHFAGPPTTFTLPNPPYIPLLVIQNAKLVDYDLSLLAPADRMVGITDDTDTYVPVKLPTDIIPANSSLFLYVAADGSSYYAYDNGSGVHTEVRTNSYPSTMDPPTAFALPAAATWP
jgi:hypothetical protein